LSNLTLFKKFGFSKLKTFYSIRTRPTKEGITFLGLSLFVGVAALNTGNNLIYLTFGMMLSFVAVSGIISMINLWKIDIRYDTPQNIFALTPTFIKVYLINKKFLIPSYSISARIEGERVFISYLPTNMIKIINIRCFFKRRGWDQIPDISISTNFPFGFFRKWIKIKSDHEVVLVYPKVQSLNIEEAKYSKSFGETYNEKLGFGNDIRSIRPYQPGDNPKFIHWRSSAKLGKLMLRELQEEESKGAVIEFNPTKDRTQLESQISRAASLLLELIRNNYEVEFIAPDKTFSSSQISRSPRPVLSYLALYGS